MGVCCGSASDSAARGNTIKPKTTGIFKFIQKDLDGFEQTEFTKDYATKKAFLMVNVASHWRLTESNYRQLVQMDKDYKDKGLQIFGYPCNQFGKQEPGTSKDIQEFCEANYGVKFEMFSKVDVNGAEACELYKHLTKVDTKPKGSGKVGWNFEKFLLNREGEVVARFDPQTKPTADEVVSLIEKSLKK